MQDLSRETINLAMQLRQRMRNERGRAPQLSDSDLIEQLLRYADTSVDTYAQRLAIRLRQLLPGPGTPASHGPVYRGRPVAGVGKSEEAPRETRHSKPGSKRIYRGRPVD
jgi:hypothetical protein